MIPFRTILIFLPAILLPATTTYAQESGTHIECLDIPDIKERLRCQKTTEAEKRFIDAALKTLAEKKSSEDKMVEEMSKVEEEGGEVYLDRDASRDKMLADEKQKLRELFKGQVCLYIKDDKCSVDGSPGSELTQRMLERHSTTLNTFIDDIEKRFTERYDKARERVLKKQLDELGPRLSVSPEQIEAFAAEIPQFKYKKPPELIRSLQSSPLADAVATLEKDMLEQIRNDHAIFEENEEGLAGIITAEVGRGLRQLQDQRNLAGGHEGGNQRAYSQIHGHIKRDIDSSAQGAKRQDGNPWRFGTVEGPEGAIAKRAASLEKERLKGFVGDKLDVQEKCIAIPTQELLKDAPTDYSDDDVFRAGVPRRLHDHVEKLRRRATELARDRIIEDYVTSQGFTPDDMERIRGLLARDSAAWYGLDSRVRRCLTELSLKAYRDGLAEQELARKHKEVEDRSFKFFDPYESYYTKYKEADRSAIVAQSVVTRIHNESQIMAIKVLSENDFLQPKNLYLNETVALFADRKDELTQEAWTAAHNQKSEVTKLGDKYQGLIQKLSREERGKKGAEQEWENKYIQDVHEAWRKHPDSLKYTDLFALTRQEIREDVHREWQKEPEPTQETVVKEDGNPGGENQGNKEGLATGPDGAPGGPDTGTGSGGDGGSGGGGGGSGCDLTPYQNAAKTCRAAVECLSRQPRSACRQEIEACEQATKDYQ